MIDPAQTALFLIVIILTILLVVLGIQVFFILKNLQKTLEKFNKVLDDAGVITESVSKPIASLSTLTMGLKTGATIARILQGGKKHKEKDKKDEAKYIKDAFTVGINTVKGEAIRNLTRIGRIPKYSKIIFPFNASTSRLTTAKPSL